SGSWYSAQHTVAQGQTSAGLSKKLICNSGYATANTTTQTDHDAETDCYISCDGGSYIAKANDASCTNVGAGYWAATAKVSQTKAGIRTKCASGLTTIGYGAGADEAGDCGRVMNVGGKKLYLRSDKKTDLALNVLLDGAVYYGNMSTADKYMSDGVDKKLKLNVNGKTYSVYDDSSK
ncbi:MAG: hypothetical protein J6R22_00560, partial [Alphaproteobacteria bacterium]|nr:hypothetical protein [Alphaproteobacteria bacterium]